VAKTSKMIRELVSDDLQVTYVQAGQHFNPSLMEAEEGKLRPWTRNLLIIRFILYYYPSHTGYV
jgi:hypothetical protein